MLVTLLCPAARAVQRGIDIVGVEAARFGVGVRSGARRGFTG